MPWKLEDPAQAVLLPRRVWFMDEQIDRQGSAARGQLVRLAALAAIGFYVGTAHLTKGHEADFGKQWLAARLVATGQGKSLFHVDVQRAELEKYYTAEVIDHGIWRDGIGGPTYPPTMGVAFAPLGWLSPQSAQWVIVQCSVLLVVIASRLVSRITAGSIAASEATLATLCFPSFFLAVGVGQNSALSLAIFAGGFALLTGRRDFLAGAVWGLFALKPTWGIAVAWIPAVVGRPRAYLGMAASASALVALTLPVCGIQSWFDWLAVARQTEHYYQILPRWTALSRDLPGLLRRIEQEKPVEFAGWAIVTLVIVVTARTWRHRRAASDFESTGPRAVALLAGAILSCPRFMFYDMTLAVVPVLAGLAGWSGMTRRARVVFLAIAGMLWIGTGFSYIQWTMLGPPLDTLALLALWLWAVAEVHSHPMSLVQRGGTREEIRESDLVAELV